MTAMIFAAGLGTRLRPFTLTAPKALFPINGKPLLQRNIEYAQSFGIQRFVINVHHFSDQILNFLKQHDNFGAEILISDETDELLETGGGLLKAKNLLGNQDFLILNSDILTDINLKQLIDFHKKNNALASLAVSDRESTRKLLFDTQNRLCGWRDLRNNQEIIARENLSKSLAFSGVHMLSPLFFEKNRFSGKFSIMKSYLDLMTDENILGFAHNAKVLDIGKPEATTLAEKYFK
ncbi:nucleotidyltransferase family protein [Ornithobacterium rhinotracheale]|uniref:nucleotidyltransferase family protein n=1 Tax=Ornithobacterium rhinotracheale TaxID=28251 RepID=UPI00055A7F80|nr:nucleotidyltransferase family protein [Ornithobacterium rhinotracheale]MCK0195048.1 nucleotidyltransferase family protein [Ornithobacterium rhinotracheale]MCK0200594.1 nucleotidyltransferase family protein [Ornithobacterium rhinotracheale]UOH64727.1 nucleotidyltransferase family protein [Ornithobacterium rhinotracheale]UOH66985.1 nucleotidyltransferase family protein [Ornithobacterium rhinotracheale]UVD88353.1 nucleotidyltransferase family protein [Ornithobacterium rhinotracheale]